MSDVIEPSARPESWPILGSHVLLTRWSKGNVLNGDHRDFDLRITGTVVETPRGGSNYFSIMPDNPGMLPERFQYDPNDREAYTISRRRVTLRRSEFWQWTCEVLIPSAPPASPVPLTIEVGDKVSYVPQKPPEEIKDFVDEAWVERANRTYLVTWLYDNGPDVTAHCSEVIPTRNRHNTAQPDWFTADRARLRLVAKAHYTPTT